MQSDVEHVLRVGGQTFLDVVSDRGRPRRARSRFRGWVPDEYILMDLPALPEESAVILKDASCVVRFVHDGTACGFDSRILDWCDMGLPFFRIAWPKDVQILHVRKHARIPVNLPCTLEYPDGKDSAAIHDLSIGGCALFGKRYLKEGTPVRLSFTLPDGVPIRNLRASVCRARAQGTDVFIGCHFMNDADGLHDPLIFYMTSTLSRMGVQPLAERRVLLVYPEDSDCRALLLAFERAGVQVISAHNAVDAFYRLRMAPPGCLVLDVQQPVIAVTDLCSAIRQTPGFETLPVFLMGECSDGNTLTGDCQALEWFSPDRVRQDADGVVSACLRSAVRAA